jgi:hypothetical protein
MSSPATKNVSAQTKTPTPQKKVVAKKEAAADKPPAKPRKPTLKEKHSRFLVSNYSLIQFLSAKGLLTDEAVETAYSEIKLFAPVDEQEAFYDGYITESKTTKKTMKKFITQRNKPPKAPRAKKERQPKAKKEGAAPKEKKPRAKKAKKEEVVVEAPPVQVQEEEEEEEEIHTQEITINGTMYLIDGENNLYSTDTHEQVGTYNTEANEIVAMA